MYYKWNSYQFYICKKKKKTGHSLISKRDVWMCWMKDSPIKWIMLFLVSGLSVKDLYRVIIFSTLEKNPCFCCSLVTPICVWLRVSAKYSCDYVFMKIFFIWTTQLNWMCDVDYSRFFFNPLFPDEYFMLKLEGK